MAVQNPTGRTLGNQNASAVAITGGSITNLSSLSISDGLRSAIFSANDGGGNLQFEFRSNALVYFDMTAGGEAADYGVRHILSTDNKQYILSANYVDAKFISGLISEFQKPISIQGYYLFAGTTAPTTRPDGTALVAGDRFWDINARSLKSWNGTAFLASVLIEAFNSAANGQSVRKNITTGLLEAFTPGAGGTGIALTDLSAVAPLSYNNTNGQFTTSIATGTIAGRATAATGVIEALTPTQARSVMGLGSAALSLSTDFATAAQGTLAGSALQPGAIGSTVQGFNARLNTVATTTNPATQKHIGLNTDGTIGFVEGARLNTIANQATPGTPQLTQLNTDGTISFINLSTLQTADGDLTAIAAMASTGIAVRTATDTWITRPVPLAQIFTTSGSSTITIASIQGYTHYEVDVTGGGGSGGGGTLQNTTTTAAGGGGGGSAGARTKLIGTVADLVAIATTLAQTNITVNVGAAGVAGAAVTTSGTTGATGGGGGITSVAIGSQTIAIASGGTGGTGGSASGGSGGSIQSTGLYASIAGSAGSAASTPTTPTIAVYTSGSGGGGGGCTAANALVNGGSGGKPTQFETSAASGGVANATGGTTNGAAGQSGSAVTWAAGSGLVTPGSGAGGGAGNTTASGGNGGVGVFGSGGGGGGAGRATSGGAGGNGGVGYVKVRFW